MQSNKCTYFNKIKSQVSFLLGVLLCVVIAQEALALTCTPESKDGKYMDCPPGERKDINVTCMKNQNANSCLDTMPVQGNVGRIAEDMCFRTNKNRNHQGMDYAVPVGTPVTAAADGKAEVISCFSGGGRTIKIVHQKANPDENASIILRPGEYSSIYMHLSEISVANGAKVKKGQVIGKAGGSDCKMVNNKPVYNEKGYGSHLHFEMRDGTGIKGQTIDPMCNEVQELCEKKSTNPFLSKQSEIDYNPQQCRDCKTNANACTPKYEKENNVTPLATKSATKAASKTGPCVSMFNEDDMLSLSALGESGKDAGINNKCAASDKGGCSYGKNQMACGQETNEKPSSGKTGNFYNFMEQLQKEKPQMYDQLAKGKDLKTVVDYACNNKRFPQENLAFRDAWSALGKNPEFGDFQDEVNYDSYVTPTKKAVGADWDKISPESQMTLVACSVASPVLANNIIAQLKKEYGSLSNIPESTLISKTNQMRAEIGYKDYLEKGQAGDAGKMAIYNAALRRAPLDTERALTSAKLRAAMDDPKNKGKTEDEIAMELTGMRLCEQNEVSKPKADKDKNRVGSASAAAGAEAISASASNRDCSVSNYRNSFKDCIFCGVFKTLFNTASLLAKKSYDALADGIFNLVVVGMALWLAMTIIKYVSSFETKDPRNLAKMIFNQAFVVMVVIIFLKMDSNTFMNMALTPIFNTGMELARMAISGTDMVSCKASENILLAADGGGLPSSMGVSIVCIIEAIQNKILDIMAVGSSAICVGLYIESWHGLPIFPHFGYLLTGIGLWIAALLLLIIYPWLLIDAILQMCVASILLPAAIGAYAFKVTRKMLVSKVWGTFMEAMFNFIFLSLIIGILIATLDSITADAFDKGLENAGNGGDYKTIVSGATSIAWWTINFLKVVFTMLLGWAVLGEAKSFASSFASGIKVGDIGSQVGTLAMSGVKGAGLAVGGKAIDMASNAKDTLADNIGEKYNDGKQFVQKQMMQNRIKNASEKGTANADGSISYRNAFGRKFKLNNDGKGYSYTNWKGQTITKSSTNNPNGQQVLSVSTVNKDGSSSNVSNDGYIKSQIQKDRNGNIVEQTTQIMTAAGKSLINNDGSTNQVALNNLMNKSGHEAETIKTAILNQLLKERMPGIQGANMDSKFASQTVNTQAMANGNLAFKVSQVSANGSTTNFSMIFGNNRIMTEVESISAQGKAIKYASDGIINKRSKYKYSNGEIDAQSVKSRYSFTQYYNNLAGNPMDENGNMSSEIPQQDILLGKDDLDSFKNQIADDGKEEALYGFK